MKRIQRVPKTLQPVVLAGVVLAGTLGMVVTATAQDVSDLQTPKGSLVLQAQGSFFVGGDNVLQTNIEAGGIFGPGHLTVNQMYVEYMIPQGGNQQGGNQQGGNQKVPVVMVHGATLSGKSWETTPDGRMGFDEYFVRQGHAVYLADQVSRARSGFNQAIFNDVRAGITTPPSAQPDMFRFTDESAWTVFRFGPTCCTPYADEQFPVQAAGEFSKQGIPDVNGVLPTPNPTYKALSDLAIKLKGAVVMGHSESGLYPLEAALTNSTGMKGLIVTEPPQGCGATTYTNPQIATLATVPILVFFGDHLDTPNGLLSWPAAFADCQAFITRVNAANGNAKMLYPPDLGIHGNSHMFMLDKNNLQIADLILKWIDENVGQQKVAKK
jgi:pimeloyl-ACP methyl ester carboxylesterase